jgi:hypothetical protein
MTRLTNAFSTRLGSAHPAVRVMLFTMTAPGKVRVFCGRTTSRTVPWHPSGSRRLTENNNGNLD